MTTTEKRKEIIDVLERTICFDPRRRASVDQLLSHQLFAGITKKEGEVQTMPDLLFQGDEEGLSIEDIRTLLAEEIDLLSCDII